jgi:uncharacterized membrane protein
MGVIKRGILGGFSNKVANIVGSSWKGIAVIKSLPLSVANPRTTAQTNQRNKFTGAVAFSSEILSTLIKPLWDRWAQRMSGYNAFIQTNINYFFDTGLVEPESLVLSRGSLTGVDTLGGSASAGAGTVTATWVDNTGSGNALGTDLSYWLVFHVESNTVLNAGVGANRAAATRGLVGATLTMGDTVWIYVAFRAANGFIVSDSSRFEITVGA